MVMVKKPKIETVKDPEKYTSKQEVAKFLREIADKEENSPKDHFLKVNLSISYRTKEEIAASLDKKYGAGNWEFKKDD